MSEPSKDEHAPLYVSSVKGHLVPRRDGLTYFGARVVSGAERAAGADPIEWNEDQVIPLTAEYVADHPLELATWFRSGALLRRSHEDYLAWLKAEESADLLANTSEEESAQ